MLNYLIGFLKYFFQRRVSFATLVDRYSCISRKARIYRFVKVVRSNIGDYSYIGPNSWVVSANIGKFCSIAPNCKIGLASHTVDFLSTSPIFTERKNGTGFSWIKQSLPIEQKSVSVGNDVWIGERVLIVGGVRIGNGAVIGAGAIVTKDVPAYAIVAGVPAKVLRFRFTEEQIVSIEKDAWWDKLECELKARIADFQHIPPPP